MMNSMNNDTFNEYLSYDVVSSFALIGGANATSYTIAEFGPPAIMIRSIYGVFGCIFIVGVLGNMLVLLATCGRLQGMQKTMRVFIANLSIADMLFLIFCMPFSASVFTLPSWIFGEFLCKFASFLMYASMYASIYTLVLMSLDRFIAVAYPLKFVAIRTKKNSVTATILVWIFSIGFSMPYLCVFRTETARYPTHSETYCSENWHSNTQRRRFHAFVFITGYALPLVVITIAYMRIVSVLWRRLQFLTDVPPHDGRRTANISRKKKKVTILVCVVVSAFGLCWLPHHIINLWMGFGKFRLTTATMIFKLFALSISSMNSCLNPVIYCAMSDNFRNSVGKAIEFLSSRRKRNMMATRHNRSVRTSRRCSGRRVRITGPDKPHQSICDNGDRNANTGTEGERYCMAIRKATSKNVYV